MVIYNLLKFADLDYLLFTCDEREINYQLRGLRRKLSNLFISNWEQEKLLFKNNSKLDLFTSLKDKFEMSEYLKVIKKNIL